MSVIVRTELLGVNFLAPEKETLLQIVAERIASRQKMIVASGNVHAFNLAHELPWLREFFNRCDYVRVDGEGLRMAARLRGYRLPRRFTWADFIWDLAASGESRGYRFFLLGAKPGVAQAAAQHLQARHATLHIAGIHHGYFDRAFQSAGNQTVLELIAHARPDILLVGMGMPLQEQWIAENWEVLPATVTMTAGAVFDYVSGEQKRPAKVFTKTGFEWLGRLVAEPRRLWRRYLLGNPQFLWRILRYP